MEIKVAHGATPQTAYDALCASHGGQAFDFVTMHVNCNVGMDAVMVRHGDRAISESSAAHGSTAFHGASSCLGAMTHDGPASGVAVFGLSDADGDYGTAVASFDDDAQAAATTATKQALLRADRVGEQPDLIWIAATPGVEEAVIAGIEAVVGPHVPIIGGSAADNSVSGDWFVFDSTTSTQSGVVVSVLFPSTPLSFAYQSGYFPTHHEGFVSKVEGRTVQEIDGRPAMDVYSEWTGGDVPRADAGEAQTKFILSESTLWPLGREINQVGEVPFYLLAHPASANPDGSVDLFATVKVGERITCMNGTKDSLIARASRVASLAREAGDLNCKPPSGALMIYCGGCMLSVQDRLGEVVSGVNEALDGAPFLGAFTFGEQGTLVKAGNRHGNLMISAIIFE